MLKHAHRVESKVDKRQYGTIIRVQILGNNHCIQTIVDAFDGVEGGKKVEALKE
jgi:hypothetical protein